jgi:hypothetical protein
MLLKKADPLSTANTILRENRPHLFPQLLLRYISEIVIKREWTAPFDKEEHE